MSPKDGVGNIILREPQEDDLECLPLEGITRCMPLGTEYAYKNAEQKNIIGLRRTLSPELNKKGEDFLAFCKT